MPYQLKLNKQPCYFPFIDEITIDEFVRLNECKSDLEKLTVLLNFDFSQLPGNKNTEREMLSLIGLLANLENEIDDFLKAKATPDNITYRQQGNQKYQILAKEIKLNKDLGKLPYGAMMKVKEIISGMGTDPFNHYEYYKQLVGHYTYNLVSGNPYNEYKANEYTEEIISVMKFTDVLRLGDFFLYTQSRFWMTKRAYYKLNLMLTKRRLASLFSVSTAK